MRSKARLDCRSTLQVNKMVEQSQMLMETQIIFVLLCNSFLEFQAYRQNLFAHNPFVGQGGKRVINNDSVR